MADKIISQTARCSSCRGWLTKADRARFPRLCQSCRQQIRESWKRDLHAVMAPDWPATTAADLRASKAVPS